MAKNDKRPIIKLRSTEGSGYTYVTRKNRTNTHNLTCVPQSEPFITECRNCQRCSAVAITSERPYFRHEYSLQHWEN